MSFRIYRDRAGGWRWRAVARNGNIMGDSGEAYTRRADAKRALIRFCNLVVNA